jgi:hypothetical protein
MTAEFEHRWEFWESFVENYEKTATPKMVHVFLRAIFGSRMNSLPRTIQKA